MKRKHYILLASFIGFISAAAQNPIETKFMVNYIAASGNDTTIEVSEVNQNSFTFVGGEGTVSKYKGSGRYIEKTEEELQEINKDVYAWIEELDYSTATLMINQTAFTNQSELGFCISKSPNVAILQYDEDSMYIHLDGRNTISSYSVYAGNSTISLDKYDLNEKNTFRYNTKWTSGDVLICPLYIKGLEYMTKYYYRPYMKFADGQIMYGGEKSFTTPRTMMAALNCEEDTKGGYYFDSETHVVLNTKCLNDLLVQHCDEYKCADYNIYGGISMNLSAFLTADDLSLLKSSIYRSIGCTDGTLYLVKNMPSDMVERFYEFASGNVTVKATEEALNRTADDKGIGKYTKNIGSVSQHSCDESWDVPGNSYIDITQSGSTNPYIAFMTTPRAPLAQKYDLYVTLVNPDPEGDSRGNRFYTYVWERETSGSKAGEFPSLGSQLLNPADSTKYFITDGTQRVSRVYLGEYTPCASNDIMVQFVVLVTSNLTITYNREMRIAQIEFIPKKEE